MQTKCELNYSHDTMTYKINTVCADGSESMVGGMTDKFAEWDKSTFAQVGEFKLKDAHRVATANLH